MEVLRSHQGGYERGQGTETRSGKAGGERTVLIGDQIDADFAAHDAIESAGAYLVADDLSIGAKMYWEDVDATADPVQESRSVT